MIITRRAFTLTETLILGALISVLVLVGVLLLSNERARTRDAKRIADMTRLAGGFALLYAQQASYIDAAAGCPKVGDLASRCTLTTVMKGLDQIADPGRWQYTVVQVPNKDTFSISFRLEKSYGNLKSGLHTLTPAGIR